MKQKQARPRLKPIAYLILVLTVSIAIHMLSNNNQPLPQALSSPRSLYTISSTRLSIVSTYCTSDDISITQQQRKDYNTYWSSTSGYMKANATRLVVDLVNSNFGDFMTEIQINGVGTIVFIAPFIIGLVLLALTFPCLLSCCICQQSCPPKCCRGKNPNYSNSELTWPTVFTVLTCLLIMAASIVAMTKSTPFFADFNCRAAKFLDDFYNGNPTANQEYFFTGVSEIRNQLTNVLSPGIGPINTQISKLTSNAGSIMDTIVTDTNTAIDNLKYVSNTDSTQFSQTYNQPLDSSSPTGIFNSILGPLIGTFGVNSTLIGDLYTYVTNNVLSNMTSITTAASGVLPHLTSGDMGAQITITDSALAAVQSNLDSLNNQITNVLKLLSNIDSYNIKYAVIFYGIVLAQASLVLIAIVFMKCFKMLSCRYFIYFICFIMFCFTVLLFLATITLSFLTPALYYTCSYFENTFTSPTAFTSMILTLQGTGFTNIANQFAQCFGGNNGFMTIINPTLQSYLSQLKTSVFGTKQYDFTTLTTSLNTKITTMQTIIEDVGLGHIPDFDIATSDGQTQISNFNSIANKSVFSSSCPSSSYTIFYQDVWVPGVSTTYQASVDCLNKVSIDNTTCTGGIAAPSCPTSRCIDSFSIISDYYRTGSIASIATDADSRYGNCAPFNTFLTNYFTNYVQVVVDSIGNTVDDGTDTSKLAGRFKVNAKTPINNLITYLNTNVKPLFNQVYNNLTQTDNLQSIFDPSVGLITGLDCRLLSQDGVAAKEQLCIKSFNRVYFSMVITAILAFAFFLALCCIVCFNVRHYQKSVQKEEDPGRIFPADQTNSEIQMK